MRPHNDVPILGNPRGSEFLFGAAGGVKFPVRRNQQLVADAELCGATAFESFMQTAETDK